MPKPPTSPTEKLSPPANRPASVKPLPLLPERPSLKQMTVPAAPSQAALPTPKPLQMPVPSSTPPRTAELPTRPSQVAKSLRVPPRLREPAPNTPLRLPERPLRHDATVNTLRPVPGVPTQNGVQRPLPGVPAPQKGSGRLSLPGRPVERAGGLKMQTPLPGGPSRPSDVSGQGGGFTVASRQTRLQLPDRPQASQAAFKVPETPRPGEGVQGVTSLLTQILRELKAQGGDEATGPTPQPINIARPLWGNR